MRGSSESIPGPSTAIMPTRYNDDQTPVVQFDVRLEISAYLVFRHLRDGRPLQLVDVRPSPSGYTLEGAERLGDAWQPSLDLQVVLFDDDGSIAIELAQRYQDEGHANVKALFGGLELWKFSLDPEVVGQATYLIEVSP